MKPKYVIIPRPFYNFEILVFSGPDAKKAFNDFCKMMSEDGRAYYIADSVAFCEGYSKERKPKNAKTKIIKKK